jgi:hypothetical protein
MNINVGPGDRVLRVVLGLVLIALAALGVVGAWGYFGILPLLTGVVRVCPAYSMLGIDTLPKSASDRRRA